MAQTRQGAQIIAAASIGLSLEDYLAKIDAGLKRCRKCQTWKATSNFTGDRSRYDGLQTICRDCAHKPPRPPKEPKPKTVKPPKPIKVQVPKPVKEPKPVKIKPPLLTPEEKRARRYNITVDQLLIYEAAGLHKCPACQEWKPLADFQKHPHKCSACRLVKVRKTTKGRPSPFKGLPGKPSPFKGKKHTPEASAKMSASRIGKVSPRRGIPRTAEERQKISAALRNSPNVARGENHYNYKNGEAQRARNDRRKAEYQDWRNAVFARDNYTCQKCGDTAGGNLRAHHIKSFSSNPELRFDVANGLTLCHTCHELEHFKPDSIRNIQKAKRGKKLW